MNYLTIAAGTIIIALFSWSYSIKHRRYHGIPRFFSFESIFILLVLNIKVWFHDPISPFQIISWILLTGSAYMGITGFILLWKRGKPQNKNIESTTVIVKSNLYSFIRHPLYSSLLLIGTGIMFKNPEPPQLVFGLVNLIAIYFTAKTEEKEMIMKFGEEYSNYMRETKMFIPFVI